MLGNPFFHAVEPEHKVIPAHKTEHIKQVLSTDEITHEEEKVALILGITSVFSIWWYFIKWLPLSLSITSHKVSVN